MNLPNKLTLSRFVIAAIVALVFLLDILDEEYRDYVTALVFLCGVITDFLDGYIARKYNQITVFGIFADPIADKVLIVSAMISLVFVRRLSPFVAIALIERDLVMTGFRLIAAEQGAVIPASISGKMKTFIEIILVLYLLLNFDISYIKEVLIGISIVLAYYSLIRVMLIHKSVFGQIH